jgi:Fe-S-cluster containining protein
MTLSKNLAAEISIEYKKVSAEFSHFQNSNKLSCIEGCGKCCMKNVSCTPIELLPMAYDLLERGKAESVIEKAINYKGENCFLFAVSNQSTGMGTCTEYNNRPLVCRSFGVAARKGKNDLVQYSVCRPLKENKTEQYAELLNKKFSDISIPFIEILSSRLAALDPAFFEEELPINQSLAIVLEKVLMHAYYAGPLTTASPETLNFPSSP